MLGGDYSAEAQADVAEHFNVSPLTNDWRIAGQPPPPGAPWRATSLKHKKLLPNLERPFGGRSVCRMHGAWRRSQGTTGTLKHGDFTAETIGLQKEIVASPG
jgi:hypothetical protein